MWIIIAAIIIVGGVFILARNRNVISAQVEYTAPVISTVPVTTTSVAIADSDWQKVLVGTDPAAAGLGKNLGTGATTTENKPLTETGKLGQVLVSDYLQLQQSGVTESTDTIDAMVSHALSDPDIVPTAKVYDFSDIKIGKDDSINATIVYGQKLGALFSNNNAVGNEAVYARDSAEQNDPTILAKIDPIITAYRNILTGLLAITAPPTIASMHLDLVNAMSERLYTAEMLRSSDPTASLEGAGEYLTALQDLYNAFGKIKQYFDILKTNFSTTTASSSIPELGG
jgi:hypothetical protein